MTPENPNSGAKRHVDSRGDPTDDMPEAPLSAPYEKALRAYLAKPIKEHIARWREDDPYRPDNDSNNTDPAASSMTATMSVLKNRYLCRQQISSDAQSEAWLGADQDAGECLVRLWPYTTEKPDDPAHALWNNELRMLYRLGSSPSAQQTMLTLRDAGIDRDSKAFVMVLQSDSGGYEQLAHLLKHRKDHSWLDVKSLRTNPTRGRIWQALHRLALGIDGLHRQHVIHRNITAEKVFLDKRIGPESCRLGGFEWSVRLGVSANGQGSQITPWATPPETLETVAGLTFQTDWYAFGMLCARILLPLEFLEAWDVKEMNRTAIQQVDSNPGGVLSEQEQSLILRLIRSEPDERLSFSAEILSLTERIARDLLADRTHLPEDRPLVLAFSPKNPDLLDFVKANAFIPDPADPSQPFSSIDPDHVARLRDFLRMRLTDSQLYLRPENDQYVLAGTPPFTFYIAPFRNPLDGSEGWDVAFITGIADLRMGRDPIVQDLCHLPLQVVTTRDAARTTESLSWDLVRPRAGQTVKTPAVLTDFHNFLRCTNQLELLLCSAEVFAYEVVGNRVNDGQTEAVTIREIEQPRNLPPFCEVDEGMFGHISRTYEAARRDYDSVFLTTSGALRVPGLNTVIDPWHLDMQSLDYETRQIRLVRSLAPGQVPAPDHGYIRTYGLYGQLILIDRRKQAIDRLEDYAYLLSALAQPGQVCLDTEFPTDNAYHLPHEKVDKSKRAVIADIERVRPIYVLNGPPGTGKTTLVAHFLRRVFTDDPLAQVLITAQAHAAVEVLRNTVRAGAYADLDDSQQPLAIRLGGRGQNVKHADAVDIVTRRILTETRDSLRKVTSPHPLQIRWAEILESLGLDQAKDLTGRFVEDFAQTVKRSASITYCTTSAGDLAELVQSSESFDWSFDWAIVEEAGKVHGFDLALPLQTGHRWFLLGDHKQLPPYQFKNFEDALGQLDTAVEALRNLPDRILVDDIWVRWWRDSALEERAHFKQYAERWLKTFKELWKVLYKVRGAQGAVTREESVGAWVGELSIQWRMHATIGDLISKTFYEGLVRNGNPSIQNPFYFDGLSPSAQPAGRAIVWIDTPWCQQPYGAKWLERGPHRYPRFTNPSEAELIAAIVRRLRLPEAEPAEKKMAILTPYTQQMYEIRKRLDSVTLPGMVPAPSGQRAEPTNPPRWVHTVDSFQGNQADAVIVSLVRNNALPPEKGLGFLEEKERVNVLLSRAERMLVLVGSWEFFNNQVRTVSLDDETHRLWFWKKALATIQEGFESGTAIRLQANTFEPKRK